jgi:hypothetical protein
MGKAHFMDETRVFMVFFVYFYETGDYGLRKRLCFLSQTYFKKEQFHISIILLRR